MKRMEEEKQIRAENVLIYEFVYGVKKTIKDSASLSIHFISTKRQKKKKPNGPQARQVLTEESFFCFHNIGICMLIYVAGQCVRVCLTKVCMFRLSV